MTPSRISKSTNICPWCNAPLPNPTHEQLDVTTLTYLPMCADCLEKRLAIPYVNPWRNMLDIRRIDD